MEKFILPFIHYDYNVSSLWALYNPKSSVSLSNLKFRSPNSNLQFGYCMDIFSFGPQGKIYSFCFQVQIVSYRPSLKKGSNQLIVTLYTLTIYSSVHKQLIRFIFEARTLRSSYINLKFRSLKANLLLSPSTNLQFRSANASFKFRFPK